MASSFVATGAGDKGHHHHHHHLVSPKSSVKKAWAVNQPHQPAHSCDHGHHQTGGALPKCVCSPSTHPGSFKCRLHRVNSHGHSAPSAPAPDGPASSTRTVEAQ